MDPIECKKNKLQAEDPSKDIKLIILIDSVTPNPQNQENQIPDEEQQNQDVNDSTIEFEILEKALDTYKGKITEKEILNLTNSRLNLEDIYAIMVETIQQNQFNEPSSSLQIVNVDDKMFLFFQYNLTICKRNYPIKFDIQLKKEEIPIEQQIYRSNQKWFEEIEKLKKMSDEKQKQEKIANNDISEERFNELQAYYNSALNQIKELNQQIQTLKESNQTLSQQITQFNELKPNVDKIEQITTEIQQLKQSNENLAQQIVTLNQFKPQQEEKTKKLEEEINALKQKVPQQ